MDDEIKSKEPPLLSEGGGGGRAVEDNRLSVPSPYTEGAAGGGGGSHDDLEYGRRESLLSTTMVCSRRQSGARGFIVKVYLLLRCGAGQWMAIYRPILEMGCTKLAIITPMVIVQHYLFP